MTGAPLAAVGETALGLTIQTEGWFELQRATLWIPPLACWMHSLLSCSRF